MPDSLVATVKLGNSSARQTPLRVQGQLLPDSAEVALAAVGRVAPGAPGCPHPAAAPRDCEPPEINSVST